MVRFDIKTAVSRVEPERGMGWATMSSPEHPEWWCDTVAMGGSGAGVAAGIHSEVPEGVDRPRILLPGECELRLAMAVSAAQAVQRLFHLRITRQVMTSRALLWREFSETIFGEAPEWPYQVMADRDQNAVVFQHHREDKPMPAFMMDLLDWTVVERDPDWVCYRLER